MLAECRRIDDECQQAPGVSAEPRFLCDEMLGRLARYLRAAGYDTLLASEGRSDSELLRRANAEGRWFLTRDRRVLEHNSARKVAVLLPPGDLNHLAQTITGHFHLDWMKKAFTRCLVDNALLLPAQPAHGGKLPKDVPVSHALHCPECGRMYWAGSHHRRMRERLKEWAEAGEA